MTRSDNPTNPLLIFLQGRNYQSAGEFLRLKGHPNIVPHAYPSIHLGFIAAELYFKCLLALANTVTNGHNLKNLYQNLPSADRRQLDKLWKESWEKSPYQTFPMPAEMERFLPARHDLVNFLEKGNFMFLKSRYSWEMKPGDDLYVLNELPEILREVILVKRPDWKIHVGL